MPSKKYIVRDGFVVNLILNKADGGTSTRTYDSGEEVTLDDDQAPLHLHKLEFASQKDRDAALAAEQQAKVSQAAASNPVDLVKAMADMLSQAQATAGVPVQAPAQA